MQRLFLVGRQPQLQVFSMRNTSPFSLKCGATTSTATGTGATTTGTTTTVRYILNDE